MNRRHLLQLATAVAGGSLLALAGSSPTSARLRDIVGNPRLLARLAEACPDLLSATATELLEKAGVASTPESFAAISAAFAERREADFLAGRIRIIEGWVVAESECALCSLIAQS